MTQAQFSEKLFKSAMIKNDMTWRSVCFDLKISQSTLSRWIKDQTFSFKSLNYFRLKFGKEEFDSIFFS